MPIAEIVIDDKTAIIPDVTRLALDDFGQLPDSQEGVADILTLSDISTMFDLRDMTLGSAIENWAPAQMEALTLNQYPFLAEMTIREVAEMVGLYEKTVGDLPIIETALATFLKHPVLVAEKKLTLTTILERYPEIGSIQLAFLELEKYNHTAIPGLLKTPITGLPDWQKIIVRDIVGLSEIPIHQDIQVDGEIVSLSTVRQKGRIEIQLNQSPALTALWSSDPEQGLQPFNSFYITPTISGESIAVSAYFTSCATASGCKHIGPFEYPDYKKGASFYVSASDWETALIEKQKLTEFRRDPEVTATVTPTILPFYKSPLLKVITLTMLSLVGVGLPSIYCLLSRFRKHKS